MEIPPLPPHELLTGDPHEPPPQASPSVTVDNWTSRCWLLLPVCDLRMCTGCDQAWQRSDCPESIEVSRCYLLSDHFTEPSSVSENGVASSDTPVSCSQTVFVSSTQSFGNSGGISHLYSFKVLNAPSPLQKGKLTGEVGCGPVTQPQFIPRDNEYCRRGRKQLA